MSMKPEDYEEFQRQLALQSQTNAAIKAKTKTDEDGVTYEWDEGKKAWFPMLSVDQMVQFQSNYSATADEAETSDEKHSKSTYMDPLTKTKYVWDSNADQWVPETQQSWTYPDNYKYTDPTTGAKYIWDAKGKAWKTDETTDDAESVKSTNTSVEAGATTYTDPNSGLKYTWSVEKHVWEAEDGQILYPATSWDQSQSNTDAESGKTYQWDAEKQTWAASDRAVEKQKKKTKPQKRSASKAEWFAVDKTNNTSVYVTGLPPDMTNNEFAELMGKCGIIMPNPVTGELKIKLYVDEIGNLKGDGLCCYMKKESVALALQLLDEMEVRDKHRINVQKASFELKGNYDPSKKPKMLSKKEKQKFKKEQEKMLDWKLNRAKETVSKTDRVVILKNMFDVKEFEDDPVLITDIRDDLRKECEKFGGVKKVIVFDRHPDGVCSVAFKEVEAAVKCQKALNGRWFACRTVHAELWDGATNYQIEETDKEREMRLKKWEQFLDDENSNAEKSKDETKTNVDDDASAKPEPAEHSNSDSKD